MSVVLFMLGSMQSAIDKYTLILTTALATGLLCDRICGKLAAIANAVNSALMAQS